MTRDEGPEPEPESTGSFQTEGRGIVDSSGLGLYVVRQSDRELYERLTRREPCYVLAPRQIGKSSLRVRTQQRLRSGGVRCVSIDLTGIGSGASAEEWYFSIASAIAEQLGLENELDAFWGKHRRMSAVRRFRQFLQDVVLEPDDPEAAPVVVFLDEIDVTLSLPFPRDDFFGLIRSTHEARADTPSWRRLTFCLIGVAAPLDLVADPERTPFNNSFAVRVDDFTAAEARTFLPGLARAGGDGEALLAAVLDWTSGHPALTQRLCYRLTRQDAEEHATPAKERVEALVRSLFLSSGRIDDPILLDAERRFGGDRPDARIPVMLHLYRRLLDGEPVAVDGNNPRQFGLRIAGLAAEREEDGGTWLRVRSRIFASVFNHAWVEEKLARRFLTEPLQIWKDSGRKDDHVLRGKALDIALTWAQGREDVTPDEHDFLHASVAVSSREQQDRQQAELDRAQRERAEEQVRSQRRSAGGLMLTAVLSLAFGVFGMAQYWKAQDVAKQLQEQLAKEQETNAVAQRSIEDRVAQLEEEANEAQRKLDAANADREKAQNAVKDAQAEADRLRREAEEALQRAGSSVTAEYNARRLRSEANKKLNDAALLNITASNAIAAAVAAEKRQKDAAAALAEARARSLHGSESVTGSVQSALETATTENTSLKKQLNERTAELETAKDEIKRLNRIIKERNEKVDTLERPRFATPPPNQVAPPKDPGDTYD